VTYELPIKIWLNETYYPVLYIDGEDLPTFTNIIYRNYDVYHTSFGSTFSCIDGSEGESVQVTWNMQYSNDSSLSDGAQVANTSTLFIPAYSLKSGYKYVYKSNGEYHHINFRGIVYIYVLYSALIPKITEGSYILLAPN